METSNSSGFFIDPEKQGKWVKWVGLGVLIYLAIAFGPEIKQWVTTAAETAAQLFRLGVTLFAGWLGWTIVKSKQFKILLGTAGQILWNMSTFWFIDKHPISVAKFIYKGFMEQKGWLDDERGRFEGFDESISEKLKSAVNAEQMLLRNIQQARTKIAAEEKKQIGVRDVEQIQSWNDDIQIWSEDVLRRRDEQKDWRKLLATITTAREQVEKLSRLCNNKLRSLENEIRHLESKFEAGNMLKSILGRLKRILRVDPDLQDLYDRTNKSINDKFANALGELRTMTRDMRSATDKMDLESSAARDQVLAELDAINKKTIVEGELEPVLVLADKGTPAGETKIKQQLDDILGDKQ